MLHDTSGRSARTAGSDDASSEVLFSLDGAVEAARKAVADVDVSGVR